MENNSSIENKPKKQKLSPKKREKKEISPVGKGVFGDVYDKFKGKAKEAFNFLASHGSGDLLGVFHRDGVGDIDVVWGDKEGGLDHIISKHVGEGKSFSDIDEAAHVKADIIKTGKNGFEDGDKIVFRKGSKLVTIRKNVRDKGKKIADKNWVLTAYDELSADGDVSTVAPTNEVQAVRHTDKSHGKVNAKTSKKQGKGQKSENTKAEKKKPEMVEIDFDNTMAKPSGLKVGKSGKNAINVFQFTEHKRSYLKDRPVLGGAHYENGVVVASDGEVLVAFSTDYKEEYEGKTVRKNGAVIEGDFPKWDTDMPRTGERVDKDAFLQAVEEAKAPVAELKKLAKEYDDRWKVDKHALSDSDEQWKAVEAIHIGYVFIAVPSTTGDVWIRYDDAVRLLDVIRKAQSTELFVGKHNKHGNDLLVVVGDGLYSVAISRQPADRDYAKYVGKIFHVGGKNTTAKTRLQKVGEGAAPVSKNERVLRDALGERLREGGMDVIDDAEEGQRVLNMANGKDVRKMSFGEPYDYEKYPLGRVEPNLADKTVEVVNASSQHGFSNYKEAKAWAKENVSKTYNNEATGGKGDVRISNGAIDKFLSQSAVDKSDNKDVHMAVLKVLPEVLKESIDVETHPDFLKGENGKRSAENGINKDVLVHRCYGAVNVDGKPYRVKITLKENVKTRETTNAYSYEATKIELLAGQHGDVTMTSPRNSNNSISGAKLLKDVEMSYNQGVKVLDESEKQVRFFRTADGEAYGFTVGGRIYIDPRIATSETPIHEYAHLWATALKQGNAEEWQNVVGLMKGTSVWNEVKKTYPELKTDDEIADEVIAHYSGRKGAERLREEAKKIAEGKGGALEKADAISALERVKLAINAFWKGVCDFLHIHYTSAEEVADRVMKDLLDGVDPRKFGTDSRLRKMGSRTNKNMAEIGKHYEGKTLTDEAQTIVDVFSGKKDRQTISFVDKEGNEHSMLFTQGHELKAGSKHAIYRHYGEKEGWFDAGEITKIYDTLSLGERTMNKGKIEYTNKENGVEYTVIAEKDKGKEHFVSFYTNRKAPNSGMQNTQQGAQASLFDASHTAKVDNSSDITKASEGKVNLQQMTNYAHDVAEALNVKGDVEVVTSEGLKGKKKQAKGWYDPKTGKITIVADNHTNAADIEQTMLHEAVAHKGLRALFGERFTTFLDNVFTNADAEVRQGITDLMSKNNWDARTATEEYLASLAEATNFEEAKRNGVWDKIKDFFRELLDAVGLSGFSEKKKGISQRVNEIKNSLHTTSETSSEFLSSDAKIPTLFEITKASDEKLAG